MLKAQISARPEYQGEIKQVIDCITPRDGIVGFVNGEPYYGSFHVMPNGVKMTGAVHSDSDLIIYDTPQESRTSRGMMQSTASLTTVSSLEIQAPEVQENVSITTTPSQTTTSTTPQTGETYTSSQQTSGQSDSSSSNNSSSSSGSSGSGGGGYGGGY